ncbi:beta-N-acetylhexosaminidase [Yoonia sp.]|uniref:beta-N-acetylhexosaminidase n=1 Tax=Yoonia sp. TaxID=2212373 RepID=UPI00238A7538|nr:beta-N-acetylhexosaminidase [Yoonia sp.]MDE0850544.1 beta-N-acetylhexosaminidase [Yoonia sp.]
MSYHLSSIIEDAKRIRCVLSTDSAVPLDTPILCFSVQAPAIVSDGAVKIEGLGGFTAVKFDRPLTADAPLSFTLEFEDSNFWVSNRAWHPQGPYLRLFDGCIDVDMDVRIGVIASPMPERRMPESGLALIPAPQNWVPAIGQLNVAHFVVTGAFPEVGQSIDRLCARRGLTRFQGFGAAVVIRLDPTQPTDGYILKISEQITLDAADAGGAFNGLISLLTLRETQNALPCGTITDAPRFAWRGFMLDCVREFYPVDAICKLLDMMALLKLNRFHWHFADDEAFRLEVKTAPDLWEKSGFRGENQFIPGVFGGRSGPTGGTYSYTDVALIIAHAKALNIEVLPEIEVPAHALALTAIRPHLRDPNDTGTEVSVQGYARNAVNPAIAATWDLLEPLSLEVAKLFPFGHLHLGGDELPEGTWDGSPLVDAYKAEHGLQTYQDVQGHLMNRLAGYLADHGFTSCAWQEAADGCTGGIGHDAILFSWTGAGPGREAARKGHRVVMCPAQHTYFDMAHSADPDDWGANWAANYALDAAYNWNPIPQDAPDLADRILGVEGTFWSEFTSDAKDFEAMIAPRIFGLATKGWSLADATTLADLRATATCYAPFFAKIGWAMHHAAIDMDTPSGNIRRVDN